MASTTAPGQPGQSSISIPFHFKHPWHGQPLSIPHRNAGHLPRACAQCGRDAIHSTDNGTKAGMNSKNEGVGAAAPQSSAPTGLLSGPRFCKTICWLRKAGGGGGISGGAPHSTQMPTFGGDMGDPGAFAGKRVQLLHPHQKRVVQVWESRVMGALFLAQARTS